ncbi:TIGR01212 family radical SAM protein [Anaerostipes sp.]|uniref:TIGR01212 family radical SAM protein n=1 Tax=Anaerostipes sp. TaxID=1872530 RepID=UPI0025B8F145|nr:TIGR01212 family radical SAM protein [Anaerostipes sp.]MBS7007822.1 TIGR01212 family radical SAM protein [Anaerostipes sp.]
MTWDGKRYYSLDRYLKQTFGEKIYKISLDGGFTCPNRDGTLGTRGCIFCSEGGSGDFASDSSLSVTEQIEDGIRLVEGKSNARKFIAYFQAFTNTYAPVEKLNRIYREALSHEKIIGLSIGTRPDCLPPGVLDLLTELNKIKPVFVELGLQTIHEDTAQRIRRGYPLSCFNQAVDKLHNRGINIVVHLILGLPGESEEKMLESVRYLNRLPVDGVKLSLLHVLKNTDLGVLYEKDPFYVYELDDYVSLVIRCIEELREDIVIHRLTGDGPRDLLIAPRWTLHKRKVLNEIARRMKETDSRQGKRFHEQ